MVKDNGILLQLTALSGLLGALITQVLSGFLAYMSDRRKFNAELTNNFRNRQVDIAENFYFVTSEKMAVLQKNINYWNNWNNSRSELSLEFLNSEINKLKIYLEKLDCENWKCNLISLYFDVLLTNELIIEFNDKSKLLFLHILDITEALKYAPPDSKSDLILLYDIAICDLCTHYKNLYAMIKEDLSSVKTALISKSKV